MRHHIDVGQRAIIANRIATLPPYRPETSASNDAVARVDAADTVRGALRRGDTRATHVTGSMISMTADQTIAMTSVITSGAVAVLAVLATVVTGFLDRRARRKEARIARMQPRLERTYLELATYVHRRRMEANAIRPFMTFKVSLRRNPLRCPRSRQFRRSSCRSPAMRCAPFSTTSAAS